MNRRIPVSLVAAALLQLVACRAGAVAAPPRPAATQAPLTVEQVIARNAAARGGVEAWQKITSMAWTGRAETDAKKNQPLPFLLQQQRPNRTRFELMQNGLRAVRAFDGSVGWKLKPDPTSGRPDIKPYTAEELAFARASQVIDGPLMDYVARGAAVSLVGEGDVDGHKAFVLDVKLPSGGGQRVWVDEQSFLEVRHDRTGHGAEGAGSLVTVYFRDYRDFQGLKMPTVIETTAGPGRPANRLIIERVALNPELDETAFDKPPERVSRRHGVVVDTRSAARGSSATAARP